MSEIKSAASAYQLFQRAKYGEVKAALEAKGQTVEFGDVQRELSSRWKGLTPQDADRARFEGLAAEDRARFQRESAEKDREVFKAQAAKRAQRETLTIENRMRGRPKTPERQIRVEPMGPPKKLSEEERAFRQERQEMKQKEKAERDARLKVAHSQHTSIKDEIAKQASARLQYLLKQSDIFKHFGAGKESSEQAEEAPRRDASGAGGRGSGKAAAAVGAGAGAEAGAPGEQEEEEEETS